MDKAKPIDRQKDSAAQYCDKWLHKFPAFRSHSPLAIGVIHEIKARYHLLKNPKFSFRKVRIQIRQRTRKKWYLAAVANGEPRLHLDGTEQEMKNPLDKNEKGV